jgi:hypothetical protein
VATGEVIGIVGSEGAKFTAATEKQARKLIRREIKGAKMVVSGACHLGGIDIWAREEAEAMGIPVKEYAPKHRTWDGSGGYKARNMKIAKRSDRVTCITVRTLPEGYTIRGFELYCYHCGTDRHVKSGGCWTTKYARKLGKPGVTLVVGKSPKNKTRRPK